MELLKSFQSKCRKTGYDIYSSGLRTAVVGLFGLVLYTDMLNMQWTRAMIEDIDISPFKRTLVVPFLVIMTILIIRLMSMLGGSDEICDEE
jgi:hypothetical protein